MLPTYWARTPTAHQAAAPCDCSGCKPGSKRAHLEGFLGTWPPSCILTHIQASSPQHVQNKTRAYKEAQNEHQTSLVTVKLTVLKSTPSKEAYSAVTAALDFSSVRVEPPSLMQEKATLSEQGRQPRGFLLVIQDKDDTLLVVPKLHCSNDWHGVKETKLNSLPSGLFS